MRIAAVADLHTTRTSQGAFEDLFIRAAETADVLALCGDLTDYGLPEEAEILAEQLAVLDGLPVVAVLGNHDYEAGEVEALHQILSDAGVILLDGDSCDVDGVGFAGVKGFCGGFGRGALSPWGERMIKEFVQEAVDESVKLEAALRRLDAHRRVVLLHYAPIADTVKGEPPEIYPFLGSSRLEEPLERYPVDIVLHGHAHHGSPVGRTAGGTPVFNVSLSLRCNAGSEPLLLLAVDDEGIRVVDGS